MEQTNLCKESIGLFIVRICKVPSTSTCKNCKKPICTTHTFKQKGITNLCLTCFTDQDTRLTKDIELYSKDRYIWRKKMIERFHKEYEYMVFLAEDYGSLFDTTNHGTYDDFDDSNSYFDS